MSKIVCRLALLCLLTGGMGCSPAQIAFGEGGVDNDRDGYGTIESGGSDCDDNRADVHPGASEVLCNSVDDDCDGTDDLEPNDQDCDGYDVEAAGGADCDDGDPNIYPGAPDILCNGIDEDCDGADDPEPDDEDCDGYSPVAGGGDDCDDTDPTINPGAPDTPFNAVDEDCNGSIYPNVHVTDQLLGAASVVAPWPGGSVAAVGGVLVRIDGEGTVRFVLGPLVVDLAVDKTHRRIAAALGEDGLVLLDGSGVGLTQIARLPTDSRGVWLDEAQLIVVGDNDTVERYALDAGGNPTLASEAVLTGGGNGVVADGNWVYISQSADTLAAIELDAGSFTGAPEVVLLNGNPQDVWIDGANAIAYVATGFDGVAAVDITDPSQLETAAVSFFGAAALRLTLGSHLYSASSAEGVRVWDPADTSAPAATVITHKARDVALEGTTLWVADDNGGVLTVDVTDPTAPALPVTVVDAGTVTGVVVRGTTGFAAAGIAGLFILDLSDPANPSPIARHDLGDLDPALAGDRLEELALAGDNVIATLSDGGEHGLVIMDLADPSLLEVSDLTRVALDAAASSLAMAGSVALVVVDGVLLTVDLTDPTSPVGPSPITTTLPPDRKWVHVDGTVAVVGGQSPAVVLLDITTPLSPTVLGTWEASGRADHVFLSGNRLLVTHAALGVSMVDVTDPSLPTLLATASIGALARRAVLADSVAWVTEAEGLTGIPWLESEGGWGAPVRVIDRGFTESVVVTGTTAMVGAVQSGVWVLDLASAEEQ